MSVEEKGFVRDLLYLDVEKAASVFSQLESGLITEIQKGVEQSEEEAGLLGFDLKLFTGSGRKKDTETERTATTRILHHDLLRRLEEQLEEAGLTTDVGAVLSGVSDDVSQVHQEISKDTYIRTEGWATIEDYSHLQDTVGDFNRLAEFISRCARYSVMEQMDGDFEEQVEELREAVESIDDPNVQVQKERLLDHREEEAREELEQLIDDLAGVGTIPEWLIEGIQFFVDVFLEDKLLLRLAPSVEMPEFEIIGNLKRDKLVHTDVDNVLFTYGRQPNVELTMLGLVTSKPSLGKDPTEVIRERQKEMADEVEEDDIDFEEALRGIFEGFDDMEEYVRYTRYPRIKVQPLAVYRSIGAPREDAE